MLTFKAVSWGSCAVLQGGSLRGGGTAGQSGVARLQSEDPHVPGSGAMGPGPTSRETGAGREKAGIKEACRLGASLAKGWLAGIGKGRGSSGQREWEYFLLKHREGIMMRLFGRHRSLK